MADTPSKGVYFLANDVIYDWAIAFLESFRQYNPDLRLILLPFDEKTDRIERAARTYGAEIYRDPGFDELERIGHLINQGQVSFGHHWFRRFAAFWGPLDEFLYLDGRTLVLSDLGEILRARESSGYQLLHYDCAMDQVYKPGDFRDKLIREQHIHGFLSTIFASYRGVFTLEELSRYADQAQSVRDDLNTRNADQCFLNYICDMKKIQYGGIYDALPNTVSSTWARIPGLYRLGDRYFRWDYGGLEHNKAVPLLHWAGMRRGPAMPYPHLHLHYSLKRESAWKRLATHVQWSLASPFLRIAPAIRASRRLNTTYHVLRNRIQGRPLPERLRAARKAPSTSTRKPGP